MANRKASGDDKMPADLFKKASEAFRKRAWILINISSQGTMYAAKNCWRLGWFFFARTTATRLYWQTINRLHSATLFTNLSTSLSLAGSEVSQKNMRCWNPCNMASEALDWFNLSSRRNAGSENKP